jgi:hypothetical protein
MRSVLLTTLLVLLCTANDGCAWLGGCPYGGISPVTYGGTMVYTMTASAADGGSGEAATGGSGSLSVTLDSFDPNDENSFNSYCGPKTFLVVLAESCSLTATVDTFGGTGSASIPGGQTCTLSTPTGGFRTLVNGGTISVSGHLLNVVLSGDVAAVTFEGSS